MFTQRILEPFRSVSVMHRGFVVAYGTGCIAMMAFLSWSLLSPDPYAVVRDSSLSWLENFGDIIAHVTAFSLCSSTVLGLFPLTGRDIPFRALVAMICYCVVLEALQTFVPGRSCDAKDAMANLCGFVLGLAFIRVISLFRRPGFAN